MADVSGGSAGVGADLQGVWEGSLVSSSGHRQQGVIGVKGTADPPEVPCLGGWGTNKRPPDWNQSGSAYRCKCHRHGAGLGTCLVCLRFLSSAFSLCQKTGPSPSKMLSKMALLRSKETKSMGASGGGVEGPLRGSPGGLFSGPTEGSSPKTADRLELLGVLAMILVIFGYSIKYTKAHGEKVIYCIFKASVSLQISSSGVSAGWSLTPPTSCQLCT